MESKMNSGTSFQQSENPVQCANGCGFFGTAATMNMCSKCYRDHRLKEDQAASAKAAVGRSMSSTALPKLVVPEERGSQKSKEKAVEEEAVEVSEVAVSKKAANRCRSCNKKVGVVGFKCRCGASFCGSHRYPEEHNCTYDYKGAGRDAIAKANPLVIAEKVQRF